MADKLEDVPRVISLQDVDGHFHLIAESNIYSDWTTTVIE
jgi:hypothetical protein